MNALVPVSTAPLEVTATTPEEMMSAQEALILWCERKIKALENDADELETAYAHAVAHKWKSSTLKRHANMARKRGQFYGKMLTALKAGYCIVPNFPVTLFAIRTKDHSPKLMVSHSEWGAHEQKAQVLPEGQGEYKNPFPLVAMGEEYAQLDAQGNKKTLRDYYAKAWAEFEFPISMSKVHIMQTATRAMALKCFDELGILPTHRRDADPVIVGTMYDPRPPAYARKKLTFMIAWHIDTRSL